MSMDPRCPRNLDSTPETFCPLAVVRLRAIRTAENELSEEEENKLPGCPWAVNSQMANYCFFKWLEEFASETTLSDVEIASLNCLSIETVKKVEKEALNKLRSRQEFQQLKEDLNGESVITESWDFNSEYELLE